MIKNKRVLILAPHTDDGEFGCGATIHKCAHDNDIYYAAFSTCELSVPDTFEKEILKTEVKDATRRLGIKEQNLTLFNYPVRTFNDQRQAILDDLLGLKNQIQPELVFIPCRNDVHQDHQVITNEAIRAFKYASILGYEMPWNNFFFNSSCFVKLQETDIEAKVKALSVYKSQAHRPYANTDFITSLARVRGVQAGHTYAEAFEVIRWIIF